jgi:hypothetical protein
VINNNETATNKTGVNINAACPRATKMRFADDRNQLSDTNWIPFVSQYS